MHNCDPTSQGVDNIDILLWCKCVLTALHVNCVIMFVKFIFISIDSSEGRKQYDEHCLSIMQTITYAHDRTHFQGTEWIVPFDLR
jgi:hypothetical protein